VHALAETTRDLAKRAFKAWSDDGAAGMGAALAFYTLLSMAPLLVLVIALAGLAIGRDEAQHVLMTQLSGLLGDTGAQGVQTVLEAADNKKGRALATAIGLFTLLVGASTVFAELKTDLSWRSASCCSCRLSSAPSSPTWAWPSAAARC
jgi:membrane protein